MSIYLYVPQDSVHVVSLSMTFSQAPTLACTHTHYALDSGDLHAVLVLISDLRARNKMSGHTYLKRVVWHACSRNLCSVCQATCVTKGVKARKNTAIISVRRSRYSISRNPGWSSEMSCVPVCSRWGRTWATGCEHHSWHIIMMHGVGQF